MRVYYIKNELDIKSLDILLKITKDLDNIEENYINKGGNSLGYVDTEGNIFHIDDSTSKDSLAANIKGTVGEDGIEKYLEIGALLLLITVACYSTGKYIGSRKKN